MSIDVVAQGAVDVSRRRLPRPAVGVLGWREARRILASPVYAVMAVLVLLSTGLGSLDADSAAGLLSGENWYGVITFFLLLYAGLLTYMAAHLVTSSARRTKADRVHESTPLGPRGRNGAMCLGVALGPGSVAVVLAAVVAAVGAEVLIVDNEGPMSVAELVQLPLLVVGGGLFGVLTATWLRFPGSLLVGLVVLVLGTGWLVRDEAGDLPWFAPYTSAESWLDAPWTRNGSHAWHAVYLTGLCVLAVCGVMLREREGRRRWLGISAIVLGVTALAGITQL